MALSPIVYALVASVIYSLSFYLKERQKRKEDFEWSKFIATAIVGVIIGCVAVVGNIEEITQTWVVSQLAVFAGLTAVIETWIKLIRRKISK